MFKDKIKKGIDYFSDNSTGSSTEDFAQTSDKQFKINDRGFYSSPLTLKNQGESFLNENEEKSLYTNILEFKGFDKLK